MEKKVNYNGLKERQQKVAENEALGLRMLTDDYPPSWKRGQEPRGIMTFTDAPSQATPQPIIRDPIAELDDLKAKLKDKGVIE